MSASFGNPLAPPREGMLTTEPTLRDRLRHGRQELVPQRAGPEGGGAGRDVLDRLVHLVEGRVAAAAIGQDRVQPAEELAGAAVEVDGGRGAPVAVGGGERGGPVHAHQPRVVAEGDPVVEAMLEAGRFPAATVQALQAKGHTVSEAPMPSGLQAIQRAPDGRWLGGADPRREGIVAGD